MTALRLKVSPVKGKRRSVEKCCDPFRPFLRLFFLFPFIIAARKRDQVKGGCTEQKFVICLFDGYILIGQGRLIGLQDGDRHFGGSVLFYILIQGGLLLSKRMDRASDP